MHLKIVVKDLVNGFDARLYRMADDVRYALGRFFDGFKVERLIIGASIAFLIRKH